MYMGSTAKSMNGLEQSTRSLFTGHDYSLENGKI